MQGETKSGFKYELSEDVLDDYELLEVLVELDEGNYGKVTKMTNILLGDEQTKALKEHVRSEHGKVSASVMLSEVMEIFASCKNGKN